MLDVCSHANSWYSAAYTIVPPENINYFFKNFLNHNAVLTILLQLSN